MGPPVEIEKPGMDGEVQKLRREKDLLIQEVVQLKQEHLVTLQQMDALNQRMQSADLRQKQMVSFLAKVLQNPAFLAHLKKLKERSEVASPRVKRKFLKQPQQQLSQSGSDKSKEQQIVKYRLGFEGDTSTSILQGLEHRDDKELPDYLLQNMVDKLGLDASEPDFLGCLSALMDPGTADLKENRKLMSQSVSSSGFFASLPEVTTTEEMLSCVISTASEHASMADSKTAELSEESALKIEADATAGDSEYVTGFPENISQERLFPGSVAPASECVNEEDIWNIDFQAGGGSFLAGDDAFTGYNAQEMEFTAGPCALWELGLHTLDEDLEIDKYVGGESSNQERPDDAALQIQDLPKNREP